MTPASATPVPAFGHVFVIIGENKALSQINATNAPYIMNTLKPQSAWLTNYWAVTAGSLADYIALTSGQYAPCETTGPCGQHTVPSIFSQLGDAGWTDWNESMPSNCYAANAGDVSTFNPYKAGHNPALYYTGLPCATNDVPAGTTGPNDMSAFNNALASGSVSKYNFVAPNLCESSYHQCDSSNIVSEYDRFLQKEIPLIEASPAFGSDGVIFVTYDEGYVPTHNENTMMAVVGPQVQAGTYTDRYDHYSTLATIQQGLGLSCLANTCTANPMSVFGTPAALPQVTIDQPASGSTVSGVVNVTGTATGQNGSDISSVQVRIDNGPLQAASGTTSWSASLDTTGLSNGTHTVTAFATDTNSETGSATIPISVGSAQQTSCPALAPGTVEYSGNVSVESGKTGWTGVYNSNSTVIRVAPAGGSYDGSYALQIGLKSGSGQVGVSNVKPVWASSVTGGKIYKASIAVKASTPNEKVSILLQEKTSGGAKVGTPAVVTVTLPDTNWHAVTDSYTAVSSGDVLHYTVRATLGSVAQNMLVDCLSLRS